ncbi:MAG: Hsp20/alpha crystallin family protein, partial [Proteobacteria bacterium]|nr:Hsp20/alpha crystallin family protein [Pseudomonadota bacterium]
ADKAVTVAVDLAGVSQRDLEVTFERGVLTVTGRRQVTAHEGGSVLRQEFESAILRRSFTLSETLDADRIDASLKNGVLTLTIPRVERAGPRKVEIRSSQ